MERSDRINVKYIFLFFLAIFTCINLFLAMSAYTKLSKIGGKSSEDVSVEVFQPIEQDLADQEIDMLAEPDGNIENNIEAEVKGTEYAISDEDKEKEDKPKPNKKGNVETSVFVNDPSL